MKSNTTITPFGACSVIANFYGFSSVQKLFKSNQQSAPWFWYLYTSEHLDKLYDIKPIKRDIAQYSLLDSVEILKSSFADFYSKELKVCPVCVKEDGLHKSTWQYTSTTVCELHRTSLVNTTDLLAMGSCEEEQQETLLSFEVHLLSLSGNERGLFANKLMTFAEYVFRPFDFITAKLKLREVSVAFLRSLFEDVYKLLCCKELIYVWEELILTHRKNLTNMGVLVTHHGIKELKAQIHSFNVISGATPVVEAERILMKYHNADFDTAIYVSTHRFDNGVDVNNVSFQVDGVMLSNFLGVHMKSVIYMAMQNTLSAVYLCKQPDKSFFDIQVVESLLSKAFVPSLNIQQTEPFINISAIPKGIYDLFDLTIEELIDAAISGQVDSQFKVNTTVSYVNHLLISEAGIKEVLKNKWQSMGDVKACDAIKMLKINSNVLNKLITQGYLVLTNDKSRIDADSIRDFVSNYLILNRKANFEKARSCEKRVTGCCKVEPIYQIYMSPNTTDFVLYNKADLNDCCMQQLQSRFTHFNQQKVDLSKDVITFQTK